MALSSLKCNGTISFVYVKSGGRIMQISGRSDSLCIFLYEMDFRSILCKGKACKISGIRLELLEKFKIKSRKVDGFFPRVIFLP